MDVGKLAQDLSQIQLYKYLDGVALALYVFDYLLTLSQELELVWKSRFTMMKLVFLLDRYFIVPNFVVQQILMGTIKPGWEVDCQRLGEAFGYMTLVGMLLSDSVLCLRLWVMWGNDKRVLTGLFTLFIGVTVFQMVFAAQSYHTNVYHFVALPGDLSGCSFHTSLTSTYILYIVNLCPDFIVLVMALIPTIQIYRTRPRRGQGGSSSLMHQVHREGVLFYFYQFIISAVCLVVNVHEPRHLFLMVPPWLVIRMILSTRMILHTRRLYRIEQQISMVTSLQFAGVATRSDLNTAIE